MHVQQISVFLENKSGRIAAAASVLKENKINIRALMIAESADYGIVRMIVNKPDVAMSALKNANFMVKQNPILAVEIDDHEGVMFNMASLCDAEKLNVEYMYSFVEGSSKKAIMFMRFEEIDAAANLFAKNGYKILTPDDVYSI